MSEYVPSYDKYDKVQLKQAYFNLNKQIDSLSMIFDNKFKDIVLKTLMNTSHISELDANVNKQICVFLKGFINEVKREAESFQKSQQ